MTNHPNRKKLSALDIKGISIPARACRRRMLAGALVNERGADWGVSWYIEGSDVCITFAYKDANVAGRVELADADWLEISQRRDGSPEEQKDRQSRERRQVHEALLWRLERAQDAVDKATPGSDLEDIARRAMSGD